MLYTPAYAPHKISLSSCDIQYVPDRKFFGIKGANLNAKKTQDILYDYYKTQNFSTKFLQ